MAPQPPEWQGQGKACRIHHDAASLAPLAVQTHGVDRRFGFRPAEGSYYFKYLSLLTGIPQLQSVFTYSDIGSMSRDSAGTRGEHRLLRQAGRHRRSSSGWIRQRSHMFPEQSASLPGPISTIREASCAVVTSLHERDIIRPGRAARVASRRKRCHAAARSRSSPSMLSSDS